VGSWRFVEVNISELIIKPVRVRIKILIHLKIAKSTMKKIRMRKSHFRLKLYGVESN